MRRRLSHGYSRLTYAGWPEKDRPWLEELPDRLGPRKFRLLLSAWCRDLTVPWLDKALRRDKRLREHVAAVYLAALDVSDRFADTGRSRTALKEARKATFFRSVAGTEGVSSVYDTLLSEDSVVGTLDRCAMLATTRDGLPPGELVPLLRRYLGDLTAAEGVAGRADIGRLGATVLGLARGIYDDRAFDRLPLLGDALQDAGCEDADVLAHCGSSGPHVRGCWVVDSLLGKG